MNWATQIADWLATTALSVIPWAVLEVVQPPHAKPMIIAMTAPQIRPQTPYLTFAALSSFITGASIEPEALRDVFSPGLGSAVPARSSRPTPLDRSTPAEFKTGDSSVPQQALLLDAP